MLRRHIWKEHERRNDESGVGEASEHSRMQSLKASKAEAGGNEFDYLMGFECLTLYIRCRRVWSELRQSFGCIHV